MIGRHGSEFAERLAGKGTRDKPGEMAQERAKQENKVVSNGSLFRYLSLPFEKSLLAYKCAFTRNNLSIPQSEFILSRILFRPIYFSSNLKRFSIHRRLFICSLPLISSLMHDFYLDPDKIVKAVSVVLMNPSHDGITYEYLISQCMRTNHANSSILRKILQESTPTSSSHTELNTSLSKFGNNNDHLVKSVVIFDKITEVRPQWPTTPSVCPLSLTTA